MKKCPARPQSQDVRSSPPAVFQSAFNQRKWMIKHGKQKFIMFNEESLLELRKYFDSLDQTGNGEIGIAQLEDPFLALGLSQGRQEVQELIKSVDLDGSGKIEFDEFVVIMSRLRKAKDSNAQKSAMYDFFQKISTDNDQMDKSVPFRLNVSQYRRRKILECIMLKEVKDQDKKQKGAKILQAFKRQLKTGNNYHFETKKGINSNGLQTFNRIFPKSSDPN